MIVPAANSSVVSQVLRVVYSLKRHSRAADSRVAATSATLGCGVLTTFAWGLLPNWDGDCSQVEMRC